MIGYMMFGTNDLLKSSSFYDKVLAPLEILKTDIDESYIGYANKSSPREVIFYITKPFDKKKATFGNGTMLALKAKSENIVDECHSISLKNKAINEGFPGIREGYGDRYYSYIRDLDNNKVCIFSES